VDDLDSKLNQLRSARAGSPGMLYHRGLGRFVYLPAAESAAEESAAPPVPEPASELAIRELQARFRFEG
ncbi:MAG TPA: hypothetical protein VGE98_15165, partial [Thermoanaerobaculia bacterium]